MAATHSTSPFLLIPKDKDECQKIRYSFQFHELNLRGQYFLRTKVGHISAVYYKRSLRTNFRYNVLNSWNSIQISFSFFYLQCPIETSRRDIIYYRIIEFRIFLQKKKYGTQLGTSILHSNAQWDLCLLEFDAV
jgi:hypothetical protein